MYDSKTKQWINFCIFSKAIGRIVSLSPKDVECFYLKLILHRVKGATCFEDSKIHKNGIYITFKGTVIAMGLVGRHKEILNIFNEACTKYVRMMSTELRHVFP